MADAETTVLLENSTLLNKYYDERAQSSLPNQDAYFQFGSLDWGYDLISENDDGVYEAESDIDLDLESIENVFYTGDATYNYVNGQIVIIATIPAGTITDGESNLFSCIGIKDNQDQLIAVAVTQPMYVYSSRSVTVEITITTGSDSTSAEVS